MARVLVTGATGFVGSHLTRRLLDEGFEVRILARPTSDIVQPRLAGAEIVCGDVTDETSVRRAVRGVDAIYHLAALFREAKHPDSLYQAVNHGGTVNLLAAALDFGVRRFVHCSTVGVHGHIANPPADETAPYNLSDVYQRSKCDAEQAALDFNRRCGLPIVVIRPAGIYGPGDLRWLKLFRSIARRRFAMIGSGRTLIHWVYVSDLVDAFRLAGESPSAVGQVYIVGGERYVTLNELVGTIGKAVGARIPRLHIPVSPVRILSGVCEDVCRLLKIEPPIYRRRVALFVRDRAFDITKARTEIAYSPKVDLAEGVRRTAEWYREHGLL